VPDDEADDLVQSTRLALPLLTLEQLDRLGAGDGRSVAADLGADLSPTWLADVRWLAALRAGQIRNRPQDVPWLLRPIILRGAPDHPAIGYINFHGAPNDAGVAEIGYMLEPEWRGHGYAIEAVRAMFGWAHRQHGVQRFRASVSPGNEPSLRLIAKLGFQQVGEQWDDEDGLELVFEASADTILGMPA